MSAGRSMDRVRDWQGPALLSYGFRPFFLGAAIWAALAMALWLVMLSGTIPLPIRLDPVSWHAHEFLFGYLGAVVAGFLLTAVPNWTGRLPIVGWPLGGLVALWIAGRVFVAMSEAWSPLVVALLDLAFPATLALVIGCEIVAGRNWRNGMVLVLLCALIVGNALFHWEAARGYDPAHGYGLRVGLAAGLMMIAVIGGRIVPSFTRNWLVRRGAAALPAPPMGRFDKIALAITSAALALWVLGPEAVVTAVALLATGIVQLARLARWRGTTTLAEPLVAALHLGYAFLPLGALAMGAALLWPDVWGPAAAQHLWMAGAVGLMTLAVMTRATLGHSGRDLHAGPGTVAIYALMLIAVLARVSAPGFPGGQMTLHLVAGLCWIASFGTFAVLYGPLLLRRKRV
ncbi:MAG: NnrS family protein [Jannaschia sp.]